VFLHLKHFALRPQTAASAIVEGIATSEDCGSDSRRSCFHGNLALLKRGFGLDRVQRQPAATEWLIPSKSRKIAEAARQEPIDLM